MYEGKNKQKGFVAFLLLVMLTMSLLFATSNVNLYAESLDDNVSNSSGNSEGSNWTDGEVAEDDREVVDMLKGYRAFDSDDLAKAAQDASPFTKVVSWAISIVILLIFSLTAFVTVLDIAAIMLPFIRRFLYEPGASGGGGFGGIGGFGRGMGGMQQQQPTKTQWISDEAVNCIELLGGSSNANAANNSGMGMMSGGFGGGMGMNRMGGMGMNQQSQQVAEKKSSVLWAYLKKRAWVLFLLGVVIVVLTSSIITDFGMNIGLFVYKIIASFSNKVPTE